MTDWIEIDGSEGEGGGQVLRTSLSLSAVTGRPVRFTNIRGGRAKPGLRKQHLAAVLAAAEITEASVDGAVLGSKALSFEPSTIKAGRYRFRIDSAGSTGLLLQTVLPPLLSADGPSVVTLEGGTHNPLSPPFHFLDLVFRPALERMGARIRFELEAWGFYPKGGGRLTAHIEPVSTWTPLRLLERGDVDAHQAVAAVSNLPASIAQRELEVVRRQLGWRNASLESVEMRGPGPGNVLMLGVTFDNGAELFSGFGELGVPAETVARRTIEELKAWQEADVPVGRHLADQLLLPFALAGGGELRTVELTEHARTNLNIIGRFLDIDVSVEDDTSRSVHLTLKGVT